ncbi:MAG: dTDP-4-dehydrorhamnose 3,5-epimerase [Desulfomonilia bacterium]|jgi:dTDP-4-dehydrorhamnose 3,5-epimerase|nr:dTDP-4-dehydrorhamnose 3,5-epimerase [Desulfomonilia bacterium]
MKITETELTGVFLIEPDVHKDERGFFLETYNLGSFDNLGITARFIQDNYSFSRKKGVIRGLHFQYPPHSQAKLVWAVTGIVYDVIVDLRENSETRGRWISVDLSSALMKLLYVPRGFAHGFCTLTDDTRVLYKVDNAYSPGAESGIRWDDPDLSIPWPVTRPILSDKDGKLPCLRQIPWQPAS